MLSETPLLITTTPFETKPKEGWWGIWHGQIGGKPYKYSGGLGTYPWQHNAIAAWCPLANKTFFVLGCAASDVNRYRSFYQTDRTIKNLRGNTLQIVVGYYDHTTGFLSEPRIVLAKPDAYDHTDVHENATLQIDRDGYLYLFINAHGPQRKHAFVWRSLNPGDISSFIEIAGKQRPLDASDSTGNVDNANAEVGVNFSYSHPWYLKDSHRFLFMHTKYASWNQRYLSWSVGEIQDDGSVNWSSRKPLVNVENGHYMVSHRDGERVMAALNYHPSAKGLDGRTNLYYLETSDAGETWNNIQGEALPIPITTRKELSQIQVHDYESEDLLVYLKDIQLSSEGHPIILYQTSPTEETGPTDIPRMWKTARWNGKQWIRKEVMASDHNYDHGSLYVERIGDREHWTIIAPLKPGPHPHQTGGIVQAWRSDDLGNSWKLLRTFQPLATHHASYVRRPDNAHPDFWGLWADGNPLEASDSSFYFCQKDLKKLQRFPRFCSESEVIPETVDEAIPDVAQTSSTLQSDDKETTVMDTNHPCVKIEGAWQTVDENDLHDGNSSKGEKSIRWIPLFNETGFYRVYLKWNVGTYYPWNGGPERAHNVPVSIQHAEGEDGIQIDQREGDGHWNLLGCWQFEAGQQSAIILQTKDTTQPVVASALKLERV